VSSSAVVIGQIGRPHGIGGAVHTRGSGRTLPSIAPGEMVEVRPSGAEPRSLLVTSRAGLPDQPILMFAGVTTREEAAALTGSDIAVPPSRLPEIDDPDTFFVSDLIGCEVLLGERPLGTVVQVIPAPANDVLEVSRPEGSALIPFTADAVRELDLAGRRIVIRPDLLGID
jgi:16S rRNA processing protein RimM